MSKHPHNLNKGAFSCRYCGRDYVKKYNLDKHIVLCELLTSCKANNKPLQSTARASAEEDEDIIELPSQRKMYMMLMELAKKVNGLDEKVDELKTWVVKKRKKINVIDWLNQHVTPSTCFDKLNERIDVVRDDVTFLLKNTFLETLHGIFARNLYASSSESDYPLCAFVQKPHNLYAYDQGTWFEVSKEELVKFLNRVHTKLYRVFLEWKREHATAMEEDDALALSCDKATCKLMDADFRQDAFLSKIKGTIYSRMKVDMKTIVEYDFE